MFFGVNITQQNGTESIFNSLFWSLFTPTLTFLGVCVLEILHPKRYILRELKTNFTELYVQRDLKAKRFVVILYSLWCMYPENWLYTRVMSREFPLVLLISSDTVYKYWFEACCKGRGHFYIGNCLGMIDSGVIWTLRLFHVHVTWRACLFFVFVETFLLHLVACEHILRHTLSSRFR